MTPTNRPSSCPAKRQTPLRRRLASGLLAALAGGQVLAAGLCPGEAARAEQLRQRIIGEWPLRGSGEEAARYLQALGTRLAEPAGMPKASIPWRFALLRNLSPNAFSIGGGYVFVTEGAATFAQNEEELAAILAHELGHELAGHFCGRPTPQSSAGFFDTFFGGDRAAASPPETAGVGALPQSIDPARELEADRIAVGLLRNGGYDPHALLRIARRLGSAPGGHSFDPRRIQFLERLLAGIPAAAMPRDSGEFQAIRRDLADAAPRP